MTDVKDQKIAANYMAAIAHLLSGRPGRNEEFIEKVDLLLAGNMPDIWQLMQFTSRVRETGRPVIWIHYAEDCPFMPFIGLVASIGGQIYSIENCVLWKSATESRARLIPDDFKMGAFRFDDDLRLRHAPKAPARNLTAAEASIVRANEQLREIEAAQRERGDVFALPELAKAA